MPDDFEPYYQWWTIWREGGRDYAESFRTLSPLTARQNHSKDLTFSWAGGKDDALVSDLWFFRQASTDVVQEGGFRDQPSGADVRHKPHLTVGGQDELPF